MAQPIEEPKVYRIPESNMPTFRERIAKLAKRAIKLNAAAPSITVLSTEDVEKQTETGFKYIVRYHNVTVTGDAPKLAGWTFAAVLQPALDESGAIMGNILRVVPGFDSTIPAEYRSAGNNCDHCHTARRRNETYVLVNEQSTWKQVGRNCLRDFLGHTSPEAYAQLAEMLIDADDIARESERDAFGTREQVRYMADEILTLGACCIRLYGFRSNATAREFGGESTSAAVNTWIHARADERKEWEHALEPNEADEKQAAAVLEWMRGIDSEAPGLTDYMYNLSLISKGATFIPRNFGLAISAIAVWAKEQEREINRRKQFESDSKSEFVGVIDTRHTFESLTLVYTRDFESDYGVSTLYKFKTPEGNIVVWFASSHLYDMSIKSDIEPGWVGTLIARIKAHDTREGIKQTRVTRGALPKPPKVKAKKIPVASPSLMKQIAWA